MGKRKIAIVIVLVIILGTTAQATGPLKAPRAEPYLEFSDNVATCIAKVSGYGKTDKIYVTMRLWGNGTCLRTWVASRTERVTLEKTAYASRGKTYTLTIDYTINGVKQTQRATTKTYV